MLIIIKWRPSSILSKIGAELLDISVFNGVFVPRWVYILLYDVINMKPQDHNVKVYDAIGYMTPQSIYDVIINVWTILWY